MKAIFIALSIFLGSAPFARAEEQPPPVVKNAPEVASPAEIMRALSQAQDVMLFDGKQSLAEQARLSRAFAEAARVGGPALWQSARNRRALALFLMTGGDAESVKDVVAQVPKESEEYTAITGAMAFAKGADKDARAILLGIDPRGAPAEIGGQIALTQGMLLADLDAPKAMAALDLARLLAPGALVEEAALRRQIFISAGGDDVSRFVALSERYRLRFPNSSFAQNFERKFREGFRKFWLEKGMTDRAALSSGIQDLPNEAIVQLYLDVARAGLSSGKMEGASEAARKAKVEARDNATASSRADLYLFASNILGADPNSSKTAPIVSGLALEDRILGEAASLALEALAQMSFEVNETQTGEDTPVMKDAQESLVKAHDLLKKSR
jgi:chemotaxis protein MotC